MLSALFRTQRLTVTALSTVAAMLMVYLCALSLSVTPAEAQTPSIARAQCDPVTQASDTWKKSTTHYILFGELHGTSETPKLFGDVVCAALKAGKKVAVGLEQPESAQTLYVDYMASGGTSADQDKFLKTTTWWSMDKDGRTSAAMFAMIEKLRTLRAAGSTLDIFVFQPGRPTSGPGDYEAVMAKNVTDAGARYSDRLVLVLVGNAHASKSAEYAPGYSQSYAPMAAHLLADATLSIKVQSRTGGSAWACMAAKDGTNTPDCSAHSFGGNADSRAINGLLRDGGTSPPMLTLLPKIEYGYDAELTVDRYTASAPLL